MKVLFVAVPLTARSGVYRSSYELVEAGRALGFNWHLYVGVSSRASGASLAKGQSWAREEVIEPSGLKGVIALRKRLLSMVEQEAVDITVSLIPQADMALALGKAPWVAYLRGLPWPGRGETTPIKRKIWELLERVALRKAQKRWSTTTVLREQLRTKLSVIIVPPGIASVPRKWDGRGERNLAVWAARFDPDKQPNLFIDILRNVDIQGVMYGVGQLERSVSSAASANVHLAGWASPETLWDEALVYLGTSSREAFGRSAVEAAMSGIPIIISNVFGCADQLITDPEFKAKFVLDTQSVDKWAAALRILQNDENLRIRYSEHLFRNAQLLTIESSAIAVDRELRMNG